MATSAGSGRPGRIPSREFPTIYRDGAKAVGALLVLFFQPRDKGKTLAVVASRKIGKAVTRNRAKRLLREAFRAHAGRLMKDGAYVLVARAGIRDKKMDHVAGELGKLLTRLDLLSDAEMRRDGNVS
jgi:ribonuclease P protein component